MQACRVTALCGMTTIPLHGDSFPFVLSICGFVLYDLSLTLFLKPYYVDQVRGKKQSNVA